MRKSTARKAKKIGSIEFSEFNLATDGIEVSTIFYDTNKVKASEGDEQQIEYSLWDFAGQEVCLFLQI